MVPNAPLPNNFRTKNVFVPCVIDACYRYSPETMMNKDLELFIMC